MVSIQIWSAPLKPHSQTFISLRSSDVRLSFPSVILTKLLISSMNGKFIAHTILVDIINLIKSNYIPHYAAVSSPRLFPHF
jgi:hypothetical protein